MSNRGLWPGGGTTFRDNAPPAIGACLGLAWVLLIASGSSTPLFTSRFECGSDPWDFLHVGELVEPSSLGFLVEAHCANAKYSPDGWIELRYGGGRVDVEVRRVDVAGTPYFRIVSIGGVATP